MKRLDSVHVMCVYYREWSALTMCMSCVCIVENEAPWQCACHVCLLQRMKRLDNVHVMCVYCREWSALTVYMSCVCITLYREWSALTVCMSCVFITVCVIVFITENEAPWQCTCHVCLLQRMKRLDSVHIMCVYYREWSALTVCISCVCIVENEAPWQCACHVCVL